MAKDLSSSPPSSRIPRLDGITTRIPTTIRFQEQQQSLKTIMPPPSSSSVPSSIVQQQQQQKNLATSTTTKITRPNSFSGLKQSSVNTITSIKKSLTGERFSETAANIINRKTAAASIVMKKFLTKPEKSEKNIEMKSQNYHTNNNNKLNSTIILEKGSKEECSTNEKLKKIDIINDDHQHHQSINILKRSDTFIRDCNNDDNTIKLNDITTIQNNKTIQSTSSNNKNSTTFTTTKIIDKSNNLWGDINNHTIIMSPTKILNKPLTTTSSSSSSSSSKLNQKHLIGITTTQQPQPQQQSSSIPFNINYTKIIDTNNKSTNYKIDKLKKIDQIKLNNLTKTLNNDDDDNNESDNINNTTINLTKSNQIFNNTPINDKKLIRKSNCFGEISLINNDNDDDDDNVDDDDDDQIIKYKLTKSYEKLNDITIPQFIDSNETITPNYLKNNESSSLIKKTTTSTTTTNKKKDMTLILNSTINNEKLIDITRTTTTNLDITHNIINDDDNSPILNKNNTTKLLYMSPTIIKHNNDDINYDLINLNKNNNHNSNRNSLVQTPDDYIESMEIDDCCCIDDGDDNIYEIPSNVKQVLSLKSLQELKQTTLNNNNKPRFSFGLDLTDCTLDCSIELCDISLASTTNIISIGGGNNYCGNNSNSINNLNNINNLISPNILKKQHSFELDESLGILTPDQMKEFLDLNTTNNTNNLDLSLLLQHNSLYNSNNKLLINQQMRIDQTPSPEDLPLDPVGVKIDIGNDIIMELPLLNDLQQNQQQQQEIEKQSGQQQQQQLNLQPQQEQNQQQQQQQLTNSTTTLTSYNNELSQTDTFDSKTTSSDQIMIKSNASSKVSTSFITSVTSITSLDTGYQGDGEMSRPASRSGSNNCDHSPSNGPRHHYHQNHQHNKLNNQISRQPSFNNQQLQQQQNNIPIRRQDPMTDSDFFTESDADIDILHHRGDRRAQVIDGQLYGPSILQQPASANVFISEQPEMEDSCMESSGIFTDIENRCDDDLATNRSIVQQSQDIDMSPDGSTDTVKSNTTTNQQQQDEIKNNNNNNNKNDLIINNDHNQHHNRSITPLLNHSQTIQLPNSETSSTINSSFSSTSINTDYNQPIIQLKNNNQKQQNYNIITTNNDDDDYDDNNEQESLKNLKDTTINYQQQQQQQQYEPQIKKALSTTINNISSSHLSTTNIVVQQKNSVKKFSPSRKHASISSSSSLLSSSPNIQAGLIKYDNSNKKSSTKLIKNNLKNVNSSSSPSTIQRINKKFKNNLNDNNMKRLTTITTTSIKNNQENKSPSGSGSNNSSSISFSSTSGGGGGVGNSNSSGIITGGIYLDGGINNKTIDIGSINSITPTKNIIRKFPPNKWDAVMNKIAENKSLKLKKNYQSIKSKISTGVLLNSNNIKINKTNFGGKLIENNSENNLIKCQNHNKSEIFFGSNNDDGNSVAGGNISSSGTQSPIDNIKCNNSSGNVSGLTSPQQKRLLQGAIKRGCSYSKDSQQSSQSDLSLLCGSPKLLAKTPARSAKKRDVRNLSISPTDLGPPSKTQTTATTPNGITRTKNSTTILSQKRASQNQTSNSSPTTTHAINKGSSPPPKKSSVRRPLDQKSHTKTTLNDHNRLIGQQHQQQNGNIKINGIIGNGSAGGLKSSTPVGGSSKLRNGTTLHNHSLGSPIEKKQTPQQLKNKQEIVKKQQNGSIELRLPPPLQPPDKSVEALGVLLQYLAYDLDAFTCPIIKTEYAQSQKHLIETKLQLEDAKTTCHDLQDQLQDKEHYYLTREQELQTLHRCELNKAETSLYDLQKNTKERIASLELELISKDADNQTKFEAYVQETNLKYNQYDKELQLTKQNELELQKRINELTINENSLRDKIQDAENKFSNKLQSSVQNEKDLTEKIYLLNKQLDLIKKDSDNKERDLEAKLHVTQDEVTVLRHSRNSLAAAASTNNTTGGGTQKNENCGASKVQMLQNEVESLRCVLEIKQNDIGDLRKKNQEIIRENEELRSMQLKFSGIESRMEDLQIQLKTKDEENKELLAQIKLLKDTCTQEAQNRSRLHLHNEELQWKLKQNSEKYAATITELSKSYQDKSGYNIMSTSKTSFHNSQDNNSDTSLNRSNCSDRMTGCCFEMDDISPPASPIIKGIVEKSDSVSYVLEMDDETTPEILAARMVRRAGSFRYSFNDKYTINNSNNCNNYNKRQMSLPMGTIPIINPLQQSASANMIIQNVHQQHSNDTTIICDNTISLPKTRNRSNSVRGTETINKKQLIRQNSINGSGGGINSGSNNLGISRKSDIPWKEPICSSSPYNRRISLRNSPPSSSSSPTQIKKSLQIPSCSIKQEISKSYTAGSSTTQDIIESNIYNNKNNSRSKQQSSSRHLITCDTSALTAGERFEMQQQRSTTTTTLPSSHSSVQDLNVLKKFQEIQESAGEAMVSGTNSEDESCSASSDDSPSISSNSSMGHHHHLHHHHHHKQHMSIEEALLLNKMNNSLGGTPMEVSWSSDAEQFPSESIV